MGYTSIPTYLLNAANNGDSEAMFQIGNMYVQNDEFYEGYTWLKKAAALGSPSADLMVRIARQHGLDVKYGF